MKGLQLFFQTTYFVKDAATKGTADKRGMAPKAQRCIFHKHIPVFIRCAVSKTTRRHPGPSGSAPELTIVGRAHH